MFLDEIPEGLWEVDFFQKSSETNIIIPAADGQLGKSDPGGSDMDSGHSPDTKCASLASGFPLFDIIFVYVLEFCKHKTGNNNNKKKLLSPYGGVYYISCMCPIYRCGLHRITQTDLKLSIS